MLYVDFGKDVVIATMGGARRFKRYTAFSHRNGMISPSVMYKAQTMITESLDGDKLIWAKNRDGRNNNLELTEEEIKQFMFQKLSTEYV